MGWEIKRPGTIPLWNVPGLSFILYGLYKKLHISKNQHSVLWREVRQLLLRLELYDDVHSDIEDRYITIGEINGVAIVVFVVYTERGDAIRLISARKATKQERRAYYDYS